MLGMEERWLDPEIKVFSDYWDSGWEDDSEDDDEATIIVGRSRIKSGGSKCCPDKKSPTASRGTFPNGY